jgi:hypothetical protein
MRDRQRTDRIEMLGYQNEQLVQRLLRMEQILDRHVAQGLKAHSDELRDLETLARANHAALSVQPSADRAAAACTSVSRQAGVGNANYANGYEVNGDHALHVSDVVALWLVRHEMRFVYSEVRVASSSVTAGSS